MSQVDQLLQQIPVGQIAERAGISEADARQAIDKVVPALVGGMQANANDPTGASSLLGALGQHKGQLDARLAGNVDTADGEKIVQNVFGDKSGDIAAAMGGGAGSGMGDVVRKILPIVAPIVIAWIANQYFSGGQQAQPADAPAGQAGAPQGQNDSPFANQNQGSGQQAPQQAPQAEQAGGGLGDLLGGLLGGGSGTSGGAGGLGDLLGGLLGGGKR